MGQQAGRGGCATPANVDADSRGQIRELRRGPVRRSSETEGPLTGQGVDPRQ